MAVCEKRPRAQPAQERQVSCMITYSVFRLAARPHRPVREVSGVGIRTGERRTCWASPHLNSGPKRSVGRPQYTGAIRHAYRNRRGCGMDFDRMGIVYWGAVQIPLQVGCDFWLVEGGDAAP
jgi:hypothetical protein